VLTEIRLAVRFTQANIVDVQNLMRGTFYDAVFCRNLLIYLTSDARQRVLQEVDRWLAPGGLFFVGHAEMLRELETRFEPVRERGVFAYLHRPGASSPGGPLPQIAVVQPVELASRPARQLPAAPSGRILARTEPIRRASPALGVPEIGARVGISSTSAEPVMDEWVQKVSELANLSRHSEAIAVCEQQLQTKGPSPQLYHMLGMVCQAAGLLEKAEQALERAVYLDPNHEEALLALALLARRRGAVQVADRLEQRSQRAHDRRPRS